MKKVLISALANVGFTLQIYGILLLFPLLSSIYFREFDSSIGFGYALLISLVVGLFLTNFFKRIELSFESIALMIPLTYIMLGFIGSIPYLFISNILFPNIDYLNIFVNSYFESNSGFTTAGLSIITSVDSLPNSFIFYRGITQWLGGISIVSLMILFVNHPGESTKIIGEVAGVEKLKSAMHKVIFDRIEAGTYIIAAALTNGYIKITNINPKIMSTEISLLNKMNVKIIKKKNYITVICPKKIKNVNLVTKPYPGFPTDLQAQIMVLMTRAAGVSTIKENIFENRFMHVSELRRMGANIKIFGNKAKIFGGNKLYGAEVMATDLRASVCLVLAGLVAIEKTTINRVYHLDRGYEKIEKKLSNCGAQIKRLQ